MNILLIGNGFDIAHGLPTKYTDFLNWVKAFEAKRSNVVSKVEEEYDQYFYELICGKDKSLLIELTDLLKENIWVEYFLSSETYNKENWVDFEHEISKMIKSLDIDMSNGMLERKELAELVNELSNIFLSDKFYNCMLSNRSTTAILGNGKVETVTFGSIIEILHNDLNKLIRALEIYLSDYITKIDCEFLSEDIHALSIDKVLSFNYTDTYERLYAGIATPEYDYIHGKAVLENNMVTNNMVLGIDEYLDERKRNEEIDFIAFKKYYQRIHKQTGCKYKEWVDEINQDRVDEEGTDYRTRCTAIPYDEFINNHNLYIYGHSLDVTDKDILRDLILNDNVYTTIFYHEKIDENGVSDNGRHDLGKKIANLVKVIHQDELIKRTSGSTKTIEFKLQTKVQIERDTEVR